MPWRTTSVVTERARFVLEAERSFLSHSELCRKYGISRPTGYLWIRRYREGGLEALEDRSHRPRSCPHQTPEAVVRRILEIRKSRGWGSKKIQPVLKQKFGYEPSRAAIDRILKQHGLIKLKKPRRRREHPGAPTGRMHRPNATWTADFKGQFRTRDGSLCYPLTVQDGHSRFLLACRALARLDLQATIRRFRRLFHEFGLPDRIRTDNGHPFASNAIARLSQLSVWWVELRITPELIEPGKPQQNGRHERMHRTLKARTANPPRHSLRAQQRRFDHFRRIFNQERPHEALNLLTPASVYAPSARPFPKHPEPITYPDHFEVRRVSQDSSIRWNANKVFVSHLLTRREVGLEEVGEGVWSVFFGPVHLGWLDEADSRIMDVRERKRRRA